MSQKYYDKHNDFRTSFYMKVKVGMFAELFPITLTASFQFCVCAPLTEGIYYVASC